MFLLFAAILFDSLWFSRNQVVHRGIQVIPHIFIEKTRSLFLEHSIAWTNMMQLEHTPRWCPPPETMWKINFDVAIRPSCSFAAVVCQNAAGNLLFA